MNQRDLIEIIMIETELTKTQAQSVLDSMKGAITRELKFDREVKLEKLGIFKVIHTKALSGRNPRTGAAIAINAKDKPVFVASRIFRVEINAII